MAHWVNMSKMGCPYDEEVDIESGQMRHRTRSFLYRADRRGGHTFGKQGVEEDWIPGRAPWPDKEENLHE